MSISGLFVDSLQQNCPKMYVKMQSNISFISVTQVFQNFSWRARTYQNVDMFANKKKIDHVMCVVFLAIALFF